MYLPKAWVLKLSNLMEPTGGFWGMFIGQYVLTLNQQLIIAISGMTAVRHFTNNQKTKKNKLMTKKTGNNKPQLDIIGYLAGLKWVLYTHTIMPNDIIVLINTNI